MSDNIKNPQALIRQLLAPIADDMKAVDDIIRTGEAAGGASGEYIGRLTSDTAEHPLGVYFFTSADKSQWYYYDVLTGEAAADYHSSYEPA